MTNSLSSGRQTRRSVRKRKRFTCVFAPSFTAGGFPSPLSGNSYTSADILLDLHSQIRADAIFSPFEHTDLRVERQRSIRLPVAAAVPR